MILKRVIRKKVEIKENWIRPYGINKQILFIFKKFNGINNKKTYLEIQTKEILIIKLQKFISKKIKHLIINEIEKKSSIKSVVENNLLFLGIIKNYRQKRHNDRLPVRGQRAHTNAKTQKRYKRTTDILNKEKEEFKK